MSLEPLLRYLASEPPAPLVVADLPGFWNAVKPLGERFPAPAAVAAARGFRADRLGYAFAAGYHAALRALVPELAADHIICFCATERGGNHPRAIQTRLTPAGDGFTLVGEKCWATLAPLAREALVVASRGDEGGKNRLAVVRVPLAAPGVTISPLSQTPFVPEVPHASVEFDLLLPSDAVLPGDGYDRYLKPFRTVEDLHVHLALLGHLVSIARRAAAEAPVERAFALVAAASALSREDPLAPAVHLALGGVIAESRRLLDDLAPALAGLPEPERARFERDRALLDVAGKARSARRESAWRRMGG
jgi:acyl-CoA dehydrogenase